MALNVLKIALTLTNFWELTYIMAMVIDHCSFNYDIKSWASMFNFMTILWLLLRGAFWFSTLYASSQWTMCSFYLLYWMPTPFEFGAFLILPFYFATILYPQEWILCWPWLKPVYFGSIAGIAIIQAIYCFQVIIPNEMQCMSNSHDDADIADCFRTEVSSTPFRAISAACFMFLAAMQYNFGMKIIQIDQQRFSQFLSSSRETVVIINLVLVACFATRSIYHLLAIGHVYILPDVPLQGDGDLPLVIFIIYELWMYLPILLIVTQITNKQRGSLPIRTSATLGLQSGNPVANYGSVVAASVSGGTLLPSDEEEASPGSDQSESKRRIYDDRATRSETIPILFAEERNSRGEAMPAAENTFLTPSVGNSWLATSSVQRYGRPRAVPFATNVTGEQNMLAGSHDSAAVALPGNQVISSLGSEQGRRLLQYFKSRSASITSVSSDSAEQHSANVPHRYGSLPRLAADASLPPLPPPPLPPQQPPQPQPQQAVPSPSLPRAPIQREGSTRSLSCMVSPAPAAADELIISGATTLSVQPLPASTAPMFVVEAAGLRTEPFPSQEPSVLHPLQSSTSEVRSALGSPLQLPPDWGSSLFPATVRSFEEPGGSYMRGIAIPQAWPLPTMGETLPAPAPSLTEQSPRYSEPIREEQALQPSLQPAVVFRPRPTRTQPPLVMRASSEDEEDEVLNSAGMGTAFSGGGGEGVSGGGIGGGAGEAVGGERDDTPLSDPVFTSNNTTPVYMFYSRNDAKEDKERDIRGEREEHEDPRRGGYAYAGIILPYNL